MKHIFYLINLVFVTRLQHTILNFTDNILLDIDKKYSFYAWDIFSVLAGIGIIIVVYLFIIYINTTRFEIRYMS